MSSVGPPQAPRVRDEPSAARCFFRPLGWHVVAPFTTLAAVTAIAIVAGLSTPVVADAAGGSITGTTLAKRLRTEPVALIGYRVTGDVDVGPGVVKYALVCRDCTFEGNLNAADALFRGKVDLSRSTMLGQVHMPGAIFENRLDAAAATFGETVDMRRARMLGAVDMTGATFRAPALFGSPPPGLPSFQGRVNFSLATFEQLATFEAATFAAATDFTFARFNGDAIFAGGESDGDTTFVRTSFSSLADFTNRIFAGSANFKSAQFRSPADFSQAEFDAPITFKGSRFDAGALFIGAQFLNLTSADDPNELERLRAAGPLDFDLSLFDRPTSFAQSAASGTVSFEGAGLDAPGGLNFDGVSVGALRMSVSSALAGVHDDAGRDRERVLSMIEANAKSNGNLGLANQAYYARQVLKSKHYVWPLRVLDFAFYRLVAGYLVRPLNPLFALIILAAVATLVRLLLRQRASPRRRGSFSGLGDRLRARARSTPAAVRGFASELGDTLMSVVTRHGDGSDRSYTRLETVLFRTVLACALIGFANSNPTLRQMFDALA